MNWNHTCAALLLAAAIVSAGCSLSTPYPNRAIFTINPGVPQASAAATQPANPALQNITLRARRIIPVPPFGGTAFVYRTTPNRLETDYYNAFAASPGDLITARLVEYLRDTHLFAAVADSNAGISQQWSLEGRLQDLAVDATDPADPKAVITLQFVLLDERDPAPRSLLERTYTERVALRTNDAAGAAEGWSIACRRIFDRLAQDLSEVNSPGQ
ncbi:MAG TPA: ABC-type transport auxiliary lipoprotein family protein [Phycisphaerae bacterium]|nr:ABC-type transport auxiliary lipoprotein family protein [Phycisphaerae bacterium]